MVRGGCCLLVVVGGGSDDDVLFWCTDLTTVASLHLLFFPFSLLPSPFSFLPSPFSFLLLTGYPATCNTAKQTEFAAQVAVDMVGSDNVARDLRVTMGAEDFSYMLKKVPGCYIWLGSSSEYFLHHPKYDFDDNTLSLGASWFVNMVQSRLKQ